MTRQDNETRGKNLQTCQSPGYKRHLKVRVRIMVFNATLNNISVISWPSVLLVEETRVPGEIHRSVASH